MSDKKQPQENAKALAKASKTNKNSTEKQDANKDGGVDIDGNIKIFTDQPLPSHNSGANKAYRASGKSRNTLSLFALICDPEITPRISKVDHFSRLMNDSLLTLIKHTKIYWPPLEREVYAFVYNNTIEQKLTPETASPALDWTYEKILNMVISPLIEAIRDMHRRDFFHGYICANNLYLTPDNKTVILGDCLSAPDAFALPHLYNTIPRGMTAPIGRGLGNLHDDIYAFGVTLGTLYRASDPLKGLNENEVTAHKVENGSYASVLGTIRVKNDFLELLRGTLIDEPTERWTIDDILNWHDGQRLSPKQTKRAKKAQRPITFDDKKYHYTKTLARCVTQSPIETLKIIENNSLQGWFKRSLDDTASIDMIELARIKANPERKRNYEHRLASHVSMILDPQAPLRYKKNTLTADGIGNALAHTIAVQADTADFTELLQSHLITEWIFAQDAALIDQADLKSRFDKCKKYLSEPKTGFGLERCVYTLSKSAPCFSDKFAKHYVLTAEDMILAFEDILTKDKKPKTLLDRHCTAFLSVRESKLIDAFLFDLNAPETYKNIMGELSTLARIQKSYAINAVPNIAAYIAEHITPVYERFHDKETQENLKDSIKKHAKSGNLIKMLSVLDNADLKKRDLGRFYGAMKSYKEFSTDLKTLENKLENKATFQNGIAHKIAASVSVIMAVFIILITLMTSDIGASSF